MMSFRMCRERISLQNTGGELLAGHRVLASASPRAAHAVRTSVSPAVQKAAVAALGSQLGGVVALQPSTGQILAVDGGRSVGW